MSQPSDSLQFADLTAVNVGGLLNEDVLQKMNDISPRETPALDLLGGGSISNPYFTWVQDTLTAPTFASKAVDGGAFAPTTAASGARVGNWAQLSEYGVNVGDIAENSSQIGRSSELAYQTTKRLAELETNIEASVFSNLPSIAGTTSVAGQSAGIGAWLETNTSHGSGGSAGGFNTSTSIVDAPTVGASRALTWALVSDRIDAAYLLGAKPTHLVTRPELTKRLGRYLISSDFFVAPVANVQGDRTTEVVPSGYIDMFKTDYGYIMKIVPSRNMQNVDSSDTNSTADATMLFGIDPQWIEVPQMWGTRIKALSADGHYTRRMIQRCWSTRMLLERAHFGIYDLQPTAAVAAS
jgi:hypothetical protein